MYNWTDDDQESSFSSAYNHLTYSPGGFIQDFSASENLTVALARVADLQVKI